MAPKAKLAPREQTESMQQRTDQLLAELRQLTDEVLNSLPWQTATSGSQINNRKKQFDIRERQYRVHQWAQMGSQPDRRELSVRRGNIRVNFEFRHNGRTDIWQETVTPGKGCSSTSLTNELRTDPMIAAAFLYKLETFFAEFGETLAKEKKREITGRIREVRNKVAAMEFLGNL